MDALVDDVETMNQFLHLQSQTDTLCTKRTHTCSPGGPMGGLKQLLEQQQPATPSEPSIFFRFQSILPMYWLCLTIKLQVDITLYKLYIVILYAV